MIASSHQPTDSIPPRSGSYTTAFTTDKSPAAVFAAVVNTRAWWAGDIDGVTDRLGGEFTYRYQAIHMSTQRITELVADQRVVWHVVAAELTFVADKTEWIGTDIVFDIVPKGDKTELRFTHSGLVPNFECYNDCSNAWGFLINGALRTLIETGTAGPAPNW